MPVEADLIVVNGRVLTMDEEKPRAEAVAIAGNEILLVGGKSEALALKGSGTRVVDAAGTTVLPGIIEGHMHIFPGAAELETLQLFGVRGFEALEAAVRRYAGEKPGAKLLVANGADYTILSGEERVTRQHLDRIVPDRPFAMASPDHHTMWANTVALERAGLLRGRDVGVGNEVVMGPDGLATGELREGAAFGPVMDLAGGGGRERLGLSTGGEPDPQPTQEERERDKAVLKRGLTHCAAHGITSFHNMDGNLYQLELLDEIDREGGLTVRARIPFHFKNFMGLEALEKASLMAERYRGEKLRSGFVKMFIDGVLDSWTAVMADDYADKPGHRGDLLFTPERFAEVATEADRRGLQIAVHSIGDGAVNTVLNGYEAARKANGPRDSRHRIEHIEVVLPKDVERFAALGVAASMQPPHPPGSMGLPLEPTISMIGERRWPFSYAWQTLRNAGARLIFGSDWPVSDINPIAGIESAVTRKLWKKGLPDQRQSLGDTLASYTCDGAWLEFMEHRKGCLKRGFLADLVVLSGDIEKVEPGAIHTLKPVLTVCDGRVSFEA
ncbi:MAG: amidohydrolase [Parvibaculaceae bacterium]